jgi:hypothetical protein
LNKVKEKNMAKRFFLVAFALAASAGMAGAMDFGKNTLFISGGFALGATAPSSIMGSAGTKDYDPAAVLGGALALDLMLFPKAGITFGLETGFWNASYDIDGTEGSIGVIPIMARFAWHPRFIKAKKFDAYLAVKVGAGVFLPAGDLKDRLDNMDADTPMMAGGDLGAVLYVTPAVGIFAELGMDMAIIRYSTKGPYNITYWLHLNQTR